MGQKIALVLSGGGARGLAHIGAIEALLENDFEISSISGASAGSLIGGIYAMNKLDIFKQWTLKLRKRDIISLMDFSLKKGGMLKGEKVFDKLRTFIPDINIENLKVPFSSVAVDILHEKEVIFTDGSIYDAIRASVSIPDVFVPVNYNNTLLVDGGVLNPVPISIIKRNKGDILVAVNLYSKEKIKYQKQEITVVQKETEKLAEKLSRLRKRISKSIKKKDKISAGYLKIIELTTDAMVHQIAEMTLDKYKPDIVVNIPADVAGIFDFDKAKYLIDFGKKQTQKSIEEYLGSKT